MKNLFKLFVVLGFVTLVLTRNYNNTPTLIADVVVENNDPYSHLKKVVYEVRPLGNVSSTTINNVASTVQSFYGFTTVVKDGVQITNDMYIKGTSEILNASICLANLNQYNIKTIYVTDKELWATGDYVKGLAYLGGNSVIVSTKSNGLVETIKHEVGHTFGLGHCTEKTCVMASANDQYETGKFCNKCKNHFKKTFNINE